MQKSHEDIENLRHDLECYILAENIRTPENVGMILRHAEAFGVKKVFFSGQDFSDLPTKAKRASRNTYRTISFEFGIDPSQLLEDLAMDGFDAYALEITNRSQVIQKLNLASTHKMIWVIGSERQGISEEALALCKNHYHIPMYGDNSSINVVNALSIALYKTVEKAVIS